MSITGHKSIQSLIRYQKTQDQLKIAMGNVMHQSLTKPEEEITVKGRKAISNKTTHQAHEYSIRSNIRGNVTSKCSCSLYTTSKYHCTLDNNIEFGDDVPDFDLLQMITQVEK